MAENTPTPSGETTTQPSAPVVPASPAPAADPAKPVVTAAAPTEPTPAPTPTETPAATAQPTSTADSKPIPASGPPEKYTFPTEGDGAVNPAAIEAMTPALKELGLSQAQASRLVGDFVKFQTGLPAAKNAADLEVIRKDPELGQMNFGKTQGYISEALAAFTTPADREALVKMGMVNDPRLVRMFARIGKAMASPGATPSDSREVVQKSMADRLYGKKSAP